MGLITDEVLEIERYINRTWKHFVIRKEVSLRELFPLPQNKGLQHIWKYGVADLVVYLDNKPVCVIEPGGSHHWEEGQMLNDRRKWELCSINNVKCLTMSNGMARRLSRRKWRALFGQYLFDHTKRA